MGGTMKIALTGATGFIGSNYLFAASNDGNEYLCLLRPTSNCDSLPSASNIQMQRTNFALEELESAFHGVDVVVHIAGQLGGTGIDQATLERGNRDLTQKVAQACLNSGVTQCVFVSTPGVQGFGHRLCLETEAYAPRDLYEVSKVHAEQILIETLQGSGCSYTIIRPDFVYGPGDTRRIKLYRNIRDRRFVLTTSGKSYLHPTHVADVVQGIQLSVGNQKAYNEIFNVSAEHDITVQEYLRTIADYFGVKLIHINIGKPLSICMAGGIEMISKAIGKEPFVSKSKIEFLSIDHSTSIQKAQKLIGYQPKYDFRAGFMDTMQWCEARNLLSR